MEVKVINNKKINGLSNYYQVNNYVYAYPDLFKDLVTIKYYMPEFAKAKIEIRDNNNMVVKTLVDEFKSYGEYFTSWDGYDNDSIPIEAGIYSIYYYINGEAILRYKIVKSK